MCPLQTPIPVSVANLTATLKATGTMEVPIIFENNTTCTFLMLSVPGLAWPFLLGENHQQSTKAIVDHHALTITFCHPQLNTTINCQSGNPAQAFPSLIPNQNSQTAAPVTCLLTGLPTPTQLYRRIPLHKGGFPVMAETTRNHIFSKEINQVIIAAMVLAPNFY